MMTRAKYRFARTLTYLEKWVPLSILIGILSGFGAFVFYKLLEFCTIFFLGELAGYYPPAPAGEGSVRPLFSSRMFLIPVVTALGGLLSGLMVTFLAPEAKGEGTDAAIDVFHNKRGIVRTRIPIIKMIASAITIGAGGSAGREGPIAQIGAGCGSLLGRLFKLNVHDRRIAVAAGIGAGIGSIFKAPLGGALLAAEILYLADFEVEALIPAFIASVVAYCIYASLTGWGPLFSCPEDFQFHDPATLLLFAVLGIMCGFYGILFVKTFYFVHEKFDHLRIPEYLKPAIGGLMVGAIGMFVPHILETGYGWLQIMILGDFSSFSSFYKSYFSTSSTDLLYVSLIILFLLPFAKILATSLSVGSGGSGGAFAPALVIGGSIGCFLWTLCKIVNPAFNISPAVFVIIGMMAFLGGVGKVPVAVIIMVSEMTGTYTLLPPSMIATIIAYVITGRYAIFRSQVRTRAESPAHRGEYHVPLLRMIYVEEAMTREVITIRPEEPLSKAAEIMSQRGIRGIPVVDKYGNLVGIVTLTDILRVPADARSEVKVEEIMSRHLIVAHPKETLLDAFDKMIKNEIGRLPVIDPQTKKLVGIITRGDIRRAYNERLFTLLAEGETGEHIEFL